MRGDKSISVCVATFNGDEYLAAQLDSIIVQLNDGDELIISDDGSSDKTLKIITSYGDNVKKILHNNRGGVVSNFEKALLASKNSIIVLSDQDDVWLPGRLNLIRDNIDKCILMQLNGVVVDSILQPRGLTIFNAIEVRKGFIRNVYKNTFVGCTLAFRRDLLSKLLPFPSGIVWHDWYIGLVAELTGKVLRLSDVSMLYRRHKNNLSQTGSKSTNKISTKIKIRIIMLFAIMKTLFLR